MPLGNNLKKKKLIPDNAEVEKKSKPAKKAATTKRTDKQPDAKKPASKKPAVKKPQKAPAATAKKPAKTSAPKKKKVVKKVAAKSEKPVSKQETQAKVQESTKDHKEVVKAREERLPETIIDSKLPMYIAKELLEKKRNLRRKYQDEIAQLREKASIQFVIINIGGEQYAIEIDNIKEIVPITEISKTPNTPSHIKGITNVRGSTYVVFDLADKFNVKGDEFPKYLLVLNDREINSSLTLSVLPSTLKVVGSTISSDLQIIEDALLDASYIKGIIQNDDKLIYYLDVITLIKNDKAIVVPDELLAQINE